MSDRVSSGVLLTAASLIGFVGVALFSFNGRGQPQSHELYLATRTLIFAAAIAIALAIAVFEGVLRDAGERVLSRIGSVAFAVAASLITVAETQLIDGAVYQESLARVYVVLAFLAQAAFGGALLRVRLLPTWVGWATVAWNIGFLVALVAVDLAHGPGYYPVLHFIPPLIIGVAVLRQR